MHAIFSPLMMTSVDRLVSRIRTRTFVPGETIVAEGDPGEDYHIIDDGRADVVVGGEVVASLGAGDGFGEMALLDDLPRSASVVARTGVTTRSLGRDDFLGAVRTNSDAHLAARDVAERHRARHPGAR